MRYTKAFKESVIFLTSHNVIDKENELLYIKKWFVYSIRESYHNSKMDLIPNPTIENKLTQAVILSLIKHFQPIDTKTLRECAVLIRCFFDKDEAKNQNRRRFVIEKELMEDLK